MTVLLVSFAGAIVLLAIVRLARRGIRQTGSLLVSQSVECLIKPFYIDDLLACVARYVQPAPRQPINHRRSTIAAA